MESFFEDNKLREMAYKGDVYKVMYLIKEKNMDVNEPNSKMRTPLHFAALEGNADVINALLRCNANIMARDCSGKTALHIAALSQSEIIRNVNLIKNRTVDTAPRIITDAEFNRDKIKEILAEVVENPTMTLTKECMDMLVEIEYGRHLDAVNALINGGASVKSVEDAGKIPLHIAVIECNPGVVKALLKRGSEYFAHDDSGCTVQDDADRFGKHTEFTEILKAECDYLEEEY